MRARHELEDNAATLDPLDGLVARVHTQLFADVFLDRDLTTLSDPARQFTPTYRLPIVTPKYALVDLVVGPERDEETDVCVPAEKDS